MSEDQQQPSTTAPEADDVNDDDIRIATMSEGQPRCSECRGANLVPVTAHGGQHVLECQDCGALNRLAEV